MKITLFAPHSTYERGTGLLLILGRHLARLHPETSLLQCSGVFGTCERSTLSGKERNSRTCLECMRDQSQVADWCEIQVESVGSYLSPEIIQNTWRLIARTPVEELQQLQYEGANIYELCRSHVENVLKAPTVQVSNRAHQRVIQECVLSTLRMLQATEVFLREKRPDLTLIAGGNDFQTRAYQEVSLRKEKRFACLCWSQTERQIQVEESRSKKKMSCESFLEDLTALRPEPETWPPQIQDDIDRILEFLNISDSQLSLPIAHSG